MIRYILLLLLVNSFVFSFVIESSTLQEKNKQLNLLNNCQSTQINFIYMSIPLCQNPDLLSSISCVAGYMTQNLNQTWNGFAKTADSKAAVSFWQFGGCSILLYNYGKYNRNYKFWPTVSYNANNQIKNSQNMNILSDQTNFANCPAQKVQAVQNGLKACDVQSNQDAADCIRVYLKDKLNEKWDAYTANIGLCALSANSFDGCGLFFSNYGSYNRTLNVWKAQSTM